MDSRLPKFWKPDALREFQDKYDLHEFQEGIIYDDAGIVYPVGPIIKCMVGELFEVVQESSKREIGFSAFKTEIRDIRNSGGNIHLLYHPEKVNLLIGSAGYQVMSNNRPFLKDVLVDKGFLNLGLEAALIEYVSKDAKEVTGNNLYI